MDIKEFKDRLEHNQISFPVIFEVSKKVSQNSLFLIHQYIDKLCEGREKEFKESPIVTTSSLFFSPTDTIKIFDIRDGELQRDNIYTNSIIICNKNKTKLDSVKIPSIEDWQIKDYILSNLEITNDNCDAIVNICKSNLFAIDSIISLVSLYKTNQDRVCRDVLDNIQSESVYSIFDLSNALIQRDKSKLQTVYKEINDIDINAFGLLETLIKNMKNVIDIQLNPRNTAESLGMNSKQFWAVSKFSCNHYSKDELQYLYKFLNTIDLKIKSGYIDVKFVIDYIITKFLGVM